MFSPIELAKRLGLLFVPLLLLAGCNALGKSDEVPKEETASGISITIHDVRVRLAAACDNLLATVAEAARLIDRKTDYLAIKRFTLVLRIRTLSECQRIQQLGDPRIGVLDLWSLAHQTLNFFETGDGQKILGDLADLAVPVIRRHVKQLDSTVSLLLPESLYNEGLPKIIEFAKDNPISGETFVRTYRPPEHVEEGGDSLVNKVLSLPFKPFEFGGGVGEAAAAINNVSVQADKFSSVVSHLALQMQWSLQYLMLALDDNKSVVSALESANGVAKAAQTLAASAKDLPEKVGNEVTAVIDRIEKSQGEMRKTLDDLKSTSSDIKTTMNAATKTMETVNQASTSLTATAEAWLPTAKAFDHLLNPPSDPNEPPDPDPFKMPQVTDASNALAGAAKELQTLVGDINKLIGSDEIPGTIAKVDDSAKAAVDHTAERATDLADHITWRGIQLVLVIFGAALVYRLVAWRFPKKGAPPA
jgi:hypothetical protein